MERVYQLSEEEMLNIKNLIGAMDGIYDEVAEELHSEGISQEALLDLVERMNDKYEEIHHKLKGIFGENSSTSYFR